MKQKSLILKALAAIVMISLLSAVYFFNRYEAKIGRKIDSYKGIPVYNNGSQYDKSYGEHFSTDGYYYGEKWQCVEFVKRFYYDSKGHSMPDVMGNAKDFFDPDVRQGNLNHSRGLRQYRNGGNEKPEVDDLLVFTDTKYGHVAIVTSVENDYIEIIQQNVYACPRQKLKLSKKNSNYYVGSTRHPAGWLRKDS